MSRVPPVVSEPGRPHRVLIVSASMGAGHDTAARVLAGRLATLGATPDVVDLLGLAGWGQGQALKAFYRQLVVHAPGAYDLVMRGWRRFPGGFERLTAWGGKGFERALAELVDEGAPDVVVSTYNLAAQALGRLRARRDIDVPVVSYVTDPGPHPYWVARGADHHLAPLPETAQALRRWGARSAEPVAPLVDDAYVRLGERAPRSHPTPRDPVVVVNGGSWGVGAAAQTARVLVAGGAHPVVLCGRSERLLGAARAVPGVRALPWVDDVPAVLASTDAVVDNAGGTTCWEALAAGLPVVVHRPIAGHGRLNAEALAAAGLVTATQADDELQAAVRRPAATAAAAVFAQPDAAEIVAGLW